MSFFEKDAPGTVANFVKLAKSGFYDGLKWHRVLPGFVIQGGDPHSREGSGKPVGGGGPGYSIPCELTGDNQFHDKGVLSMAHHGPDTGGSQFFVCLSRAKTAHLDRRHTVFGKVTNGLDILEEIRENDTIEKIVISQ